MGWRDESQVEPRRRRILWWLGVLVGCQLAWLGLHHVSLAWCVDGQTLYGFPLPYVRWNRISSLEYVYSPLAMLLDLLFYGAVLAPALVFVGRKLGGWWPRALVFAVLAPCASLQVLVDLVTWNQNEGLPPRGPLHGVHLYLELRPTFPYEDSRCPPSGG